MVAATIPGHARGLYYEDIPEYELPLKDIDVPRTFSFLCNTLLSEHFL